MRPLTIVVFLSLAGCAHQWVASEGALKARAAFQFSCPEKDLRVVSLGGGLVAGVEGCNRRDVYVFSGGAWLLNPAPAVKDPPAGVGIVVPTGDVVIVP